MSSPSESRVFSIPVWSRSSKYTTIAIKKWNNEKKRVKLLTFCIRRVYFLCFLQRSLGGNLLQTPGQECIPIKQKKHPTLIVIDSIHKWQTLCFFLLPRSTLIWMNLMRPGSFGSTYWPNVIKMEIIIITHQKEFWTKVVYENRAL